MKQTVEALVLAISDHFVNLQYEMATVCQEWNLKYAPPFRSLILEFLINHEFLNS